MENQPRPADEVPNSQKKEWYKSGWGLIIAILFFPYFLLWLIWTKTNWSKKVKWAITIFFVIINISALSDSSQQAREQVAQKQQESAQATQTSAPADANKKDEQNAQSADDALKTKMQREVDSTKKGIEKTDVYRGSVEGITMEIVLFGAWAQIIKEAQASNNDEIKKLGTQLESQVKQIQIKEFPLMRKDYAQTFDKKAWESNVDVTTSGTGNRTLTLTGGVFASNKNVGDLQSSLEDMLKKLRFDRVNYKWYEYDDKYNYFDLKSPKDADIVPIQ